MGERENSSYPLRPCTIDHAAFIKFGAEPWSQKHTHPDTALSPPPPLQVYRGRLPVQKVLPHPLPNEDASHPRLFQDAHLHLLRVSAHPPRPGPHPVPGGGQLPYAACPTDPPQLWYGQTPPMLFIQSSMLFRTNPICSSVVIPFLEHLLSAL